VLALRIESRLILLHTLREGAYCLTPLAMNRNTRPPIQTRKPNTPLPSGGGRGDGYDQHTREFAIDADQAGISNSAFFEDQRQQRKYPSNKSVKRWQALRQQYGHVWACRRTGNARATVLVRDHNIILLALYRT
jgi:hypothetical protein